MLESCRSTAAELELRQTSDIPHPSQVSSSLRVRASAWEPGTSPRRCKSWPRALGELMSHVTRYTARWQWPAPQKEGSRLALYPRRLRHRAVQPAPPLSPPPRRPPAQAARRPGQLAARGARQCRYRDLVRGLIASSIVSYKIADMHKGWRASPRDWSSSAAGSRSAPSLSSTLTSTSNVKLAFLIRRNPELPEGP